MSYFLPFMESIFEATDPFLYSAWDGTQEVPEFSAGEILDQLSDDLLRAGDPRRALRSLLQRGFTLPDGRRFDGLRRLIQQMQRERESMLDRYDPSRAIDAIKDQLDSIVTTEREGIESKRGQTDPRPDSTTTWATGPAKDSADPPAGISSPGENKPDASRESTGSSQEIEAGQRSSGQGSSPRGGGRDSEGSTSPAESELDRMLRSLLDRKESQLDQLPPDNAGRIHALREYDFISPEAREAFERLIGDMQRRLLQQYAQSMKDGIGQVSPEDLAGVRQMVQDLNAMIEASRAGDRGAFDRFMEQWGGNFAPGVESLDDLMQHLQRQASQLQSLLDSMDEESRQDLMNTITELLRDDRLQLDLARLAANLDAMGYPIDGGGFPFEGADAPGFGESLDMMRRLQAMERLEEAMARDPLSALTDAPDDVGDPSSLFGRRMGAQIGAVKDMAQSLMEAGYLRRNGEALELTPRAIRRLGDSALREIFQKLKNDRQGGHETHRRGQGGDLAPNSREYQFGDPFHVDLRGTLMNGIRRGARSPVRLAPGDFQVFETEHAVRHATVLAIDTSRSMFLRGLFLEAKKTALALDSLIRGQFPHDSLYIIGFADIAFELTRDELPALAENYMVQGTNYEMALALSRRLLARHRSGNRQVLFVTDGEPTACSVPNGGIYVNYPAPSFVRRAALAEAARCRREDIVVNTFMLDDDPGLVAFVERMTHVNRGRAFLTGPHHLGEQVLLDYLDKRVAKRF
ncbi:MAG TPA: VWA domain-containing protein [Chloroflexota bacterium]|nr:VWA domain-containing protein [Chloroflexota bacterium]